MTTTSSTTTVGVAAALALAALFAAPADGAFTLADVQYWVGAPAGPAVHEAVLVIDWNDGSTPLAWGYRWQAEETKTGVDLVAAVVGADPRLNAVGAEANFVTNFTYDGRSQTGLTEQPFTYWQYWVNNAVIDGTPENGYEDAAHVLPPNGNPYDGDGPGAWVASSTGIIDRPLADGSWDGFVYANFGESDGPLEPVAAAVPEPTGLALAAGAMVLCFRRRKRAA